MVIGERGIALIKEFEGYSDVAYPDPGTGDEPWTIGYGSTRIFNRRVRNDDVVTIEEAEEQLVFDLEEFSEKVTNLLQVEVSQNQFDSLVCFAYNVGTVAMSKSTLLMLLNEGRSDEVPAQFLRWNKAGGMVMAGLTRRRQAEADLFAS